LLLSFRRAKNLVAKASPRLFRNFNIRDIVVHPKYDPATNDNDVAIAYLRKPIFSPLQLGIMGSPFTSKHLNLGIVVNNSTVTEVIFHEKDVLNMRLLSTVQSGSSCDSSHATVCAISVEPDNQCPTNKGGPVVNLFTESLVGISSFNPDKECNPGEAEGFTRIDLYRLWIDAEITKLPLININDYASKAFNYIGK
jgi:secreted trypsin-like serine protease